MKQEANEGLVQEAIDLAGAAKRVWNQTGFSGSGTLELLKLAVAKRQADALAEIAAVLAAQSQTTCSIESVAELSAIPDSLVEAVTKLRVELVQAIAGVAQ